ncbi:hypothetical protein AK812_SmicGene45755, partial [Symbiodinium microadriaticum]
MVSVFAWRHQGRREMLFLEWSRPGTPCMQGQCHFLRVTRNGFYRMGHEGQWQLRLSGEGPVLDLLNFRCEASKLSTQLKSLSCAKDLVKELESYIVDFDELYLEIRKLFKQ